MALGKNEAVLIVSVFVQLPVASALQSILTVESPASRQAISHARPLYRRGNTLIATEEKGWERANRERVRRERGKGERRE